MKKAISILLLVVLLGIPSLSLAVTVNSIFFVDNIEEATYDIRGVINDGTTIQTSYGYYGYEVYLKVGEDEKLIEEYTSGEAFTNNGIELKILSTSTGDDKSLNIVYKVKNTSEEEKQFAIATTADTELGSNDYAAIYKDETAILQITQDNNEYEDEDYGTQVKIAFSPVATTTWIGRYYYRYENRYVDGKVTSYTYDSDVDTGLAFSWRGTLAAGEETTYTASYTISAAEIGKVSFYKSGETTPIETLEGLVGGTVITPTVETEEEMELGEKYFWNTQEDGSGKEYESGKGLLLSAGEMKLYAVKRSLWHDVTVSLSDGMNVNTEESFDGETGLALEFLLEKGLLVFERGEDTVSIYNEDDKLLFTVSMDGILTLAEDVSYKDNIEYTLTDEDKELLAENDVFINNITVSFGNAPEPFQYKILEGANQTHVINDGKDIVVKTNGEVSKLTELKVDNNTVNADNYTIAEGSTIATLKTAYLDTLTEGEHTLTFVYNDGEVSTNFTVNAAAKENAAQDTTSSSNPPTGDTIFIWFGLMATSIIGAIVVIILKRK